MTGQNWLKFSLTVKNKAKNLTFFSIPTKNSYQTVENISYPKSQVKQLKDDIYGNAILLLDSPISAKVGFTIFPKSQNLKLTPQKLSYPKSLQRYLRNNKYINGKDLEIIQISKKIQGKSVLEITKNSYDFVLHYLIYGNPTDGLYSYRQALQEKITDCGGFSTLLCSILNSKGIPTRLVFGFLIKNNFFTKVRKITKIKPLDFENLYMHAWVEALLPDGSWFPMDPSIEWRRKKGLTKRSGGFGFIPNDRLVVSFGQDFDIKVDGKKYKVELLQKPVTLKK